MLNQVSHPGPGPKEPLTFARDHHLRRYLGAEPGAVLITVDDIPLLVWDHLKRYKKL